MHPGDDFVAVFGDFFLMGGIGDEVVEAVGVFFEVVEFFGDAVEVKVDAFLDFGIGFAGLFHGFEGEVGHVVGVVGFLAAPFVVDVSIMMVLEGGHGEGDFSGGFVVDGVDVVAAILFLAVEEGDVGAAIHAWGLGEVENVEDGGHEVDAGDEVVVVDGAGLGMAGPADDEGVRVLVR